MTSALEYLLRWAEEHQWGWLVAAAASLLALVKWVDDWLYQRYRSRLDDERNWNDRLEERVDVLEDELSDERDEREMLSDELKSTRAELRDARNRLREQEDDR